ncbi:Putative polyketide synthase protein [Salinisphaera shabanensis E1L3A]|uniref:Polyketide synthase protein n=1 Tax=Salinisphaera shabanensis E1L3A TaxID=1033802 RepID=U2E3X2_9GAMM|nr:hybrid non-ribosomal peptide synthetase/type I polyketide synthase [Salinisphaera shabanensis]ERJ18531.1 Putative polyketide synthase protein [Salinisphaera shabanensis E1L3A]
MSAPRDIAKSIPTPTQRGMILQAIAAPDSPINVEQFVVRLNERFDPEAFAAAWRALIARHELLRARYDWQPDGTARRIVQDTAELSLQIHDASAWSAAEVEAFTDADFHKPIDLAVAPVFRFTVLDLGGDEWRLLWSFHHVIMDGRGSVLTINEFFQYYDAFARGAPAPDLAPPQSPNALFEWHATRDTEPDRRFWRDYLRDAPSAPLLQGLGNGSSPDFATVPRSERVIRHLDAATTARLSALVGERGIGWPALVEGLWAILLWRHTGARDVLYGVTRSGRLGGVRDADRVLALFINTTPSRATVDADMSLRAFLRERRQDQRRTHRHQHLGLLEIQRASGTGRGLLNSIVIYDHKTIDAALEPCKRGHDWHFDLRGHTGYPLTLFAYGGDQLKLDLSYDPQSFDEATANRLIDRLVRLAESASEQGGDVSLQSLEWLATADRTQLIEQWQPQPTVWSNERKIDDTVAAWAKTAPDRIAVCCESRELSYAALDTAIDQLAARLATFGVRPHDHVAIFLPRSEFLVIAALAVQRLGAAYVPCDPTHPGSRLARVFDVAQPVCVITQRSVVGALPDNTPSIIELDDAAQANVGDASVIRPAVAPHDTAYVIFTSGSSGQPKGVVLTHANVMNFLQAMIERPGVAKDNRWLAVTTLSFDIAVLELFGPLLVGARVVVAQDEDVFDGIRLARLIDTGRINRLQATPSTWRLLRLADWAPPSGFVALVGGEPLDAALARDLLDAAEGDFALWNMYGPTETTVWSTCERVIDSSDIGIGTPIANTRCHVVDTNGALVAPGVVGELYIGGDGVAAGYLNDPERSAAAFIDWSPAADIAPERTYKTGDLARWQIDAEGNGRLKCLGRSDDQIKIRGHRIEPGEIETALTAHASVKQAVVRLVGDQTPRLVAYLRLNAAFDEDTIRAHANARLPSVMCPNVYMPMDVFPLTANGKIDRRSLPMPDPANESVSARSYIAPRSDIEKTLATIWTEVTGAVRPGIDDSFFDIGGDSLSLVVARGRITQEFGNAPSIAELFQYATIRKLAERLAAGADTRAPAEARTAARRRTRASLTDRRVAIIGMAGRFPGAADTDAFWANLVAGVESFSHFDAEALRPYEPDIDTLMANPEFVTARGVLDDIEYFDASFFGITPREAALIDPQQRLWLETAWTALEQAGVDPARSGADVGVFAGAGYLESYLLHNILHDRAAIDDQVRIRGVESFTAMVSNDKDYLPTRTAYKFGLTGPAINVQTACSTGLVAVHQACMSLLAGESRMAIAGGVSIGLPQEQGYFAQEGGMASQDGHVRTFDERACGTVFSSGLGAVVLKCYDDAVADGDDILAVIRGSAINNDGAAKMSFTAPSPAGQAGVIHQAQQAAGVSPDEVSYVEAHGTGTPLGDPIEVEGLAMAWRAGGAKGAPVWLGSVKPNVGHLDSAAGVAGLVKVVHAVREGRLPGTLHYTRPNPRIDFSTTPFRVVEQLTSWPSQPDRPRIAGVSSFGVGGTNAHVIVSEPPPRPASSAPTRVPQLLVLSAKTPTALAKRCTALAEWLTAHPDTVLADVAWTLAVGRAQMSHRIHVVAGSVAEAAELLGRAARRAETTIATEADAPPVVFVLPGQGAQYPGMGRALYEAPGVYRDTVDRLATHLEAPLGLDIRTLILAESSVQAEAARKLADTAITQPAVFVIELALAYQWRAWGIEADMLVGHSVGEFATAVLAGVFSEADACELIATRARLMAEQPAGAMLAVHAAPETVEAYLEESVEISAINAPELCVVSGDHDMIDALATRLEKVDIRHTRLATSHAFHSRAMTPAMAPLEEAVAAIKRAPAQRPIVSTLTGELLDADDMQAPDYWSRQMRSAVRFSAAIESVRNATRPVFIECGPGGQLTSAIGQQEPGDSPLIAIPSQPGARDETPADVALLKALGALWQAGVTPDWHAVFECDVAPRQRLHLPTYPFERQRYWIDPPQRVSPQAGPQMIPSVASSAPSEPVAAVPDRLPELRARLRTLFHDLSGIDIVDDLATKTFAGLGMDSMFLTQVAAEISRDFGVNIRFRDLLERVETLDALAAHLDAEMPAPVAPTPAQPEQAPAHSAPQSVAPVQPAVSTPSQPSWPQAAASTAAAPATSETHRIVEQQLALMQQQLALLGAAPSPTTPNTPPPATPPSGSHASATASSAPAPAGGTQISLNGRGQGAQSNMANGRFGPYRPLASAMTTALTAEQRRFIDTLTQRLVERTPASRALAESGRQHLADPRHVVGFHRDWKGLTYQIAMCASDGARVTDIDGNDYIDLTMSLGVAFLGHGHPAVRQAVHAQLDRGMELGPQAEAAPRVAERLCRLTGHERATFTSTGSEAVMAALRCARTVTGRQTIVYFSGDYHGTFDEVLGRAHVSNDELSTRPGAPGVAAHAVDDVIVLDYDSPASLSILRERAGQIAAVLVEPVQSRHPDRQPAAFVREVREITERAGAALILDEMITGFRCALGGLNALWGIRADMCTYGKILGGGLPIGALAGSARWLDSIDGGDWRFDDDSVPEAPMTFFAGTHVRHPLAIAAADVVLDWLETDAGASQRRLDKATAAFAERINTAMEQGGVPLRIRYFSSWFRFDTPPDQPLAALLAPWLIAHGVYVRDWAQNCFFSIAHTEQDIDTIERAIRAGVDALVRVGALPGEPSGETDASAAVEVGASAGLAMGESMPLIEAQREIWLAQQVDPDVAPAYNQVCRLTLEGPLDKAAFAAAVEAAAARHESLSLRFSPDGESQYRPVDPRVVRLEWVDDRDEAQPQAAADQAIDAMSDPILDLSDPDTALAVLVVHQVAADLHVIGVLLHHLVCDGWSSMLFFRDLGALYAAHVADTDASLPEPVPFSRHVAQQMARDFAPDLAWWRELYATAPPELTLPTRAARPEQRQAAGHTTRHQISNALIERITAAATERSTTRFALTLAAFAALIMRLSGQRDIVVAMPVAGQVLEGETELFGHCVQTLPLRLTAAENASFDDLLGTVRQAISAASDHAGATYGQIVREVAGPRDPSRLPLAEIMFNCAPDDGPPVLPGLKSAIDEPAKTATQFDLHFDLEIGADGWWIDCDYATALFDVDMITRWLNDYESVLAAIVDEPSIAIDALPVQAAVRDDPGARFNPPPLAIEPDVDLVVALRRGAAAGRNTIAVAHASGDWDYDRLGSASDRIAAALAERGIGPGQRVGLCARRTPAMIAGLIGILKAGAAYLPMDPSYPLERLLFTAQDSGVALTLVDDNDLPLGETPTLTLDSAMAATGAVPQIPVDSEREVYVIYTSGSTGRPKGVSVRHRNVLALLAWAEQAMSNDEIERMLAATSICFDVSVFELFVPLCRGKTIVLVDDLLALVTPPETPPTTVGGVPSALSALLRHVDLPASVRTVVPAGEPLRRDLVARLFAQPGVTRVMECYGPTESTVFATSSERQVDGPETIGPPIAGWRAQIVDAQDRPVAIGEVGELLIGGAGVASGYVGRPDLTAERFVPDPDGEPGARRYRSGDMCRWRSDGQIEFVGRADTQVKLRGYRIELGEIESVLTRHPAVENAVVGVRCVGEGDDQLIAWWQPAAGQENVTPTTLRRYLRDHLPLYMVAQQFVVQTQWPRLANGKIDRNALVDPFTKPSAAPALTQPNPDAIAAMTALWSQALGHDVSPGPQDTFIDMGGHSLLAVRAVATARERHGVEVPVRAMMLDSLGQLAMRLAQAENAGAASSADESTADAAAPDDQTRSTSQHTDDAAREPGERRSGLMARLGLSRPS